MTTRQGHFPGNRLRLASCAALVGLVALLATSCNGDGSVARPTGSPSRTAAAPTSAGDEPAPTSDAEEPAPAPTRTERPPRPTPTAADEPPATEEEQAEPTSAAPTPTPASTTSASGESETSGVPTWLWWVLGALALIAIIAVPLLVRRRRQAWEADFSAAAQEVIWLARDLVPQLRLATSADQVRGGWAVSADRVAALEDRLTALEATARNEESRPRARILRDAVRASRARIQAVANGTTVDIPGELGQVASDLEAGLAAALPESQAPKPPS
jgi:hypothetical protein